MATVISINDNRVIFFTDKHLQLVYAGVNLKVNTHYLSVSYRDDSNDSNDGNDRNDRNAENKKDDKISNNDNENNSLTSDDGPENEINEVLV